MRFEKLRDHMKTFTSVWSVALFIVTKKNWRETQCPPVRQWVNERTVVHPHNGILFSDRKNELPSLGKKKKKWINLKYCLVKESRLKGGNTI